MKPFTYAIPCLFGLEGLVGDEVRRLGLEDVQVGNGRVLCCGTGADLPRLNLDLRCGERVLLQLARFPARASKTQFGIIRFAWSISPIASSSAAQIIHWAVSRVGP